MAAKIAHKEVHVNGGSNIILKQNILANSVPGQSSQKEFAKKTFLVLDIKVSIGLIYNIINSHFLGIYFLKTIALFSLLADERSQI